MTPLPRWLMIVSGLMLMGLFVWYFSNVITYLLIAGILSLVGQPMMEFLAERKIRKMSIPRGMAALMTMSAMLFTSLLFLSFFVPLIIKEANVISSLDIAQLYAVFEDPLRDAEALMKKSGLLTEQSLSQYVQQKLKELISVTNITSLLGKAAGITGDLFLLFVSVSFILFFFLKEKNLFFKIIIAVVPREYEENARKAFHGIKRMLIRYFIGILVQAFILAIILVVALSIAGVKNALLIAFMGALLNIIPYVGVIIAVVIGIIVAIAGIFPIEFYPGMVWLAAKVGIVFWLAQLIDNFIIQPLIFSSSLKAHPLEIFLVILAGGTAGGILGMVLAVPAYTVIRVIAKEFFSEFRIVKILTGDS